ncbi:erythromycin esterase family protein [Actinomadura sp. WMMB 499]|uniref:erythromycin esterase family protein n=1 Tax=Actinomadura sp. WMMB 499 TaxID=1219491 RepID=UPI0012487933|nr:erythromycin esterase family protein [Actinomadura sp. WMMB 499]QFG22767.1 erythromycin esterase family protein [Actinomadura sp. WMMB 499]
MSVPFREHAAVLRSLEPDGPLDDLEPLRGIFGDARVVAVGEGCHFVREFGTARRRIVRFLAERCGFTVLAFEFGFAEAFALDRWIAGTGEDGDLSGMPGTTYAGMTGETARWLRARVRTGEYPVRLAGIDVPQACGTVRPALEPVADYLREVDPDAVGLVDTALGIDDRFGGASMAEAAPRWGELEAAERDELTASLARLLRRARALEPRYVEWAGRERYGVALRMLEAAAATDHMFAAMHAVFSGGGLPQDTSVRERFMADSMRWHMERAEPGTRFVLAAHNNHIQKTPIFYGGELWAYPMGYYLARELGDDYRAVALTHTAGSVPEMHPDGTPGTGFSVVDTPMPPPGAGSVEGALAGAGLGEVPTLTDVRAYRGGPFPDRIRSQSEETPMAVADAFDGVLSTPVVTPEVITSF